MTAVTSSVRSLRAQNEVWISKSDLVAYLLRGELEMRKSLEITLDPLERKRTASSIGTIQHVREQMEKVE